MLWENDKILVTSLSSFSHNVFLPNYEILAFTKLKAFADDKFKAP